MRLKNKVAVVTGGTSGIGFAIAHAYIEQGAKVVVCGRDAGRLEQAQQALGASGLAVRADITVMKDIDELMRQTAERFGKIDILVPNAGEATFGPIDSVTPQYFDELYQVLLKGQYFTIQKALKVMNDGASIVLISAGVSARRSP